MAEGSGRQNWAAAKQVRQVFKIAINADTIGNRLKEVQDGSTNLAKFGSCLLALAFARSV